MDIQLIVLCALTFVIHVIGTLAYAVRIAGIRTQRLAVSFALFNILILVSRTSNSFQGPFLAKRVEHSIARGGLAEAPILADMRWLLLSATVATLLGGLFIPTFQRVFSRAVRHFHTHRSLPRLFAALLVPRGMSALYASARFPSTENLRRLASGMGVSKSIIGLNTLAVALWTVGVFASLYAGILRPDLRVTCSTLSSIVNGLATILLFVVIDPQVSVMTDDVIDGKISDGRFRRAITSLIVARFAGTILAQLLLVPAAIVITHAAELL